MRRKLAILMLGVLLCAQGLAQGGTWTTLDGYPGANWTTVYGIDGSNLVGMYGDANGTYGFLYDGDSWSNLPIRASDIDGSNIVGGHAIYDMLTQSITVFSYEYLLHGIDGSNIVGSYSPDFGISRGVLYDGLNWIMLNKPGLPPLYDTSISGIDGSNLVGFTGRFSSFGVFDPHGFLYNMYSKSWITLNMPGTSTTVISGIDGNNIVGYADGHGFLYNLNNQNWITVDMPGASGTMIEGIDGNNLVGTYTDAAGVRHCFIYTISEPAANAGPDTVVFALLDSIASVTLDGSDSNDPDGNPLTYKWTWPIDANVYEANGVSPTIELPIGVHTIQLVVNDGFKDSLPDDVNITVIAPLEAKLKITPQAINRRSNQPYIQAVIELPQGVINADIDGNEPLTLYGADLNSGGVEAASQLLSTNIIGKVSALFGKAAVMTAVPTDGDTELTVAGKLKTGQWFYGRDTVRIIGGKPLVRK